MAHRMGLLVLVLSFFSTFIIAQSVPSSTALAASTLPPTAVSSATAVASSAFPTIASSPSSGNSSDSNSSIPSITSNTATQTAPDVLLNVPTLSVGRIELDVENLQADINLNAQVAGLVTINAGVMVAVQKVNITISDVDAQLELIVRLGHLVDIVNRVFHSLDLNPLLISTLNAATTAVDSVVGAVDGLLGSITQGGSTLNFVVDNLGNIVQEIGGTSSIVGNYLTNMTATGATQTLQNGNTQKSYNYSPLNALVNIVFNSAGQIVQATVAKPSGSGSSSSGGPSTSATAPAMSAPRSAPPASSAPASGVPVSIAPVSSAAPAASVSSAAPASGTAPVTSTTAAPSIPALSSMLGGL